MKILLLCLFMLLPMAGITQEPDPVVVGQEIVALMKSSQQLACEGLFENAIEEIEHAESLTQDVFGVDCKRFAICLYYHGRICHLMGNYKKAETCYLSAKKIFDKDIVRDEIYFMNLWHLTALYPDKNSFLNRSRIVKESIGLRKLLLETKENRNYTTIDLFRYDPAFLRLRPISQKSIINSAKIDLLDDEKDLLFDLSFYLGQMAYFYAFEELEKGITEREKFFNDRWIIDWIWPLSDWERQETANFSTIVRSIISSKTIEISNDYGLGKYISERWLDNEYNHKGGQFDDSINKNREIPISTSTVRLRDNLLSCLLQLESWYETPIFAFDTCIVNHLEEKVKVLQSEIIRRSNSWIEDQRFVRWQTVRDSLHTGEAAIQFQFNFDHNEKNNGYYALVLRHGYKFPMHIELCKETYINAKIEEMGLKAIDEIDQNYQTSSATQDRNSLYSQIWKPLEPYLSGVKTIYCAPTGLLHRLNLAVIADQSGKNRKVVTLGSTRRIALQDKADRVGQSAYLVGGVNYNASAAENSQISPTVRGLLDIDELPIQIDSVTRRGNKNFLLGTLREVFELQSIFEANGWVTEVDTGTQATEERFRSLGYRDRSPRVLHIATHGFFIPDTINAVDPLLRSGLYLAGANDFLHSDKKKDGILTAYEVGLMNLSNTELVVLSGCKTGLGEIINNDGVYGLQRAFKVAGVKYLICSLWDISDNGTPELMIDFYRQWLVFGKCIPDAFRAAQEAMKIKYPDEPYYWAGFVLLE